MPELPEVEAWRRALDGPGTAADRLQRLGAASIRFAAESALITAIATSVAPEMANKELT